MLPEHCSLRTSDESSATKIVMMSSVHWCQAMQLISASRRGSPRSGFGSMQEPVVVTASNHHGGHSMLGTHTLDECVVSDLIHLSGRGVLVTIYLCHVMATVIVDSETAAASVDNET